MSVFSTVALCLVAAAPAARIAVVVDDPSAGTPVVAALEAALQQKGYAVVSPEVSKGLREILAPGALMGARLPEGLSVLEADAVLAGSAAYGTPQALEGIRTQAVSVTARLIDLGTGQATRTLQAHGRGLGLAGPDLAARGSEQAVKSLFAMPALEEALGAVGPRGGMVTLVVQGLSSRDALHELRAGLQTALAGIPVKEVYFARGLGKLQLGGSKAKSMVGSDIADLIAERKEIPLVVEEVANTRIVARHKPARAVAIHALVLEPKVPKAMRARAAEIGKYVATRFATFDFARASYQPGRVSRRRARRRARELGAQVIVESEIITAGANSALTIRVVDATTGRPIYRKQTLLKAEGEELETADTMLASLNDDLPEQLRQRAIGVPPPRPTGDGQQTAEKTTRK